MGYYLAHDQTTSLDGGHFTVRRDNSDQGAQKRVP